MRCVDKRCVGTILCRKIRLYCEVSMKKLHKHHSLPVGKSIESIEWHLNNLWNDGWKTIIMLTPKQHKRWHKKNGYEKFSNNL